METKVKTTRSSFCCVFFSITNEGKRGSFSSLCFVIPNASCVSANRESIVAMVSDSETEKIDEHIHFSPNQQTNKQTIKQTNKQTNKQTEKLNRPRQVVFVVV